MTENEKELISVIREADDPFKALMLATEIFTYLKQPLAFEEQAPACPVVSA